MATYVAFLTAAANHLPQKGKKWTAVQQPLYAVPECRRIAYFPRSPLNTEHPSSRKRGWRKEASKAQEKCRANVFLRASGSFRV
jgi:hypothetical protein